MSILKFRRRNGSLHAADPLTERIPRVPPHFQASPQVRAELARIVAEAEAAAQAQVPAFTPDPDPQAHQDWWGYGQQTALDQRSPMPRPYVPPFDAIFSDLGGCTIFRDTVSSVLARDEPRHGCGHEMQGATWRERHAGLYRHRTGAVPEPDFDIERLWAA